MNIINPATGKVIHEVAEDTAGSVSDKVAAARAAQPAWAAVPLKKRIAAVAQFKELLAQRKNELAATLTAEMGKPLGQALGEVNATGDRILFFLDHVEAVLQDETVSDGGAPRMQERISWEPLGVIANASAWNYPYFVGSNVFIPALLTGNAVVYKPSEYATLTGLAIVKAMHEAGVPKEVMPAVVGPGPVGAQLIEQPLNGVFFTGSYPTGLHIAAAAARQLMKAQLELGGKDPVYVCEDVDVNNAAVGLADGAFYNTGQSCCSVERIYVHKKVVQAFTERFVQEVKGFVVGDPLDSKTYIGPLTRAQQLDVLDSHVQDARERGGQILCGGKRMNRPGNYYEPTVIGGATHAMSYTHEESFGPIIGIYAVGDDAEAVSLMNQTQYGLTAGVYSKDETRARRILAEIHSGSVYWNCCDRVSPRLPWTGRKHSGIGSTLSTHGIRTFVQPKAWHLRSPA